jgi:hypothetical protein
MREIISAGTLYINSFSGFMLTTDAPFIVHTISRSGFLLTFDSPKRAALPTWRPIPQLTNENLSKILPGAPPQSVLRLAVLPSIAEDGSPMLQQVWGDDVTAADLHKDTFSILVHGNDDHGGRGQEIARAVLQSAFVWLRVLTKQWWLGRPSEAITGNLHFSVPVIQGGVVKDAPAAVGKKTTPSPGTLRVSPALWVDVLNKVAAGTEPDSIRVLAADASYYYFTEDYRTALLITCSIAEIERDRIIDVIGAKKKDMRVNDTDILAHVVSGFERAIGRNMKTEEPEAFWFLKACWIARGHMAHGKPLIWRYKDKVGDFSKYRASDFVERLELLVGWLKSVP